MTFSRARWLASAAAATVAAPRRAGAQAPLKIRLGGVPTDDTTPVMFALRNGLYQKAGLDVEFVATASGSAATAAVVAGALEMGKGSLIASLVAHLRDLPLVIVANATVWDRKAPYDLNLVAADSPLRTGADCNGKIAASPGLNDIAQLGVLLWMDANGGDSKSLKWVELPNSAVVAALSEHRVDISSLNEPLLKSALSGGKVRVLGDGLSEIGDHYVFGVYFARGDWAAKNADAVRRWVRITYEAAAYANAHKAETIPMMAEITKIPVANYQNMTRALNATTGDPAMIQPPIEAAARYKFIPRSFPAKEAYFTG